MADTLSRITGPKLLGSTGDVTLFQGTAGHTYTIRNLRVVNNTTTAQTIKVAITASGDTTINDADLILPDISVPAKGTLNHDCFVVFSGTERIMVNCGSDTLSYTISGLDQS